MSYAEVLLIVCTLFATVKTGESCTDRFATMCARHKREGHCEDLRWARMLKNMCPKTCHFCKGPGKTECVDANAALCRGRQRMGQCDQPSYYTLTFCKKTCNFCSGHIKRKVVPKPPPCTDNLKDCERIAAKGLCEKFGKYKLPCRRSCKVCEVAK